MFAASFNTNYAGAASWNTGTTTIIHIGTPDPESASSLWDLQTLDNIHKEINTMSAAVSGMGRDMKAKTAALIRELIATKHLFAANAAEDGSQSFCFDWKKPIDGFQISQGGMLRLLKEISPHIAASESRVAFLKNYVNDSVPGRRHKGLKDLLITPELVRKAPCDWPLEAKAALIHVLRTGQWKAVDVSGANLKYADLEGVQWPDGILRETDLTGCNLRFSNLNDAHMEAARALDADFGYAKLNRVKAQGASFIEARFFETETQGADFTKTRLEYSKGLRFEQGATFTDARLTDVNAGWDLNKNLFTSAQVSLVAQQLHTLSSIHPAYDKLHNKIVWSLLGKIDRDSYEWKEHPVMTDFLLNQARCWPHERIAGFINNVMLSNMLAYWNVNPAGNQALLRQVLTYLTDTKPALDWPQYGGAISQLQMEARQSGLKVQRDELGALLKAHPAIAPLATAMERVLVERFEKCSIFMSPDLAEAIVYSSGDLRKMVEGQHSPYAAFYFVRNSNGAFGDYVLRDLNTIERCKVPMGLYKIEPPSVPAIKLLSHIFGGSEFEDKYINALTCKTLAPKVVNAIFMRNFFDDDIRLGKHLEQFIDVNGTPQINVRQCKLFWKILSGALPDAPELKSAEGDDKNKNAKNIARMLLCLGTLITRYSSSQLFGLEGESLNSQRNFAWACIHASYTYDATLLGREKTIAIGKILEGKVTHEIEGCTALLTAELLGLIHARIANDADIPLAICFKAIYPQAGL